MGHSPYPRQEPGVLTKAICIDRGFLFKRVFLFKPSFPWSCSAKCTVLCARWKATECQDCLHDAQLRILTQRTVLIESEVGTLRDQRNWIRRTSQPFNWLWDQGVYPHFCDTRESPLYMGGWSLGGHFCCITEVVISHSPEPFCLCAKCST